MHWFHSFHILNYRWLRILTIINIISINTIEAEHIVSDAFKTTSHNESVLTTSTSKSTVYEINEKRDSNSSQWSVSRPSNFLRQLWFSASKSINNSELNSLKSNDFSENNTNIIKNVIFGPIKWSSEIVPSVPLRLQLSKDAIFLPHYPINRQMSKSSPDGGITVINGRVSSPVIYQSQYQSPIRTQLSPKFERLQVTESSVASNVSEIYLIENSTEVLNTSDSVLVSTVSYLNDSFNDTNDEDSYSTNTTESSTDSSSINTTSTITPIIESNSTSKTSLESFISKSSSLLLLNSTQKQELNTPEARRQAIKLTFGMRVLPTPPKESIDNFLSVLRPSIKRENRWNSKFRSESSEDNLSTHSPKIYSANSFSTITNSLMPLKEKLISNPNYDFEETIISTPKPTERIPIAVMNRLLPAESRQILSNILLFPSRPTPILKPRISNNPVDCSRNKINEHLFRSLFSKRINFLNKFNNTINKYTDNRINTLDRKIGNQMNITDNNENFKIMDRSSVKSRSNRNKKDLKDNSSAEDVYSDYMNSNEGEHSPHFDPNDEEFDSNMFSPSGLVYDENLKPLNPVSFLPKYHESNHQYLPLELFEQNQYENKKEDKYKNLPNPKLFKKDLEKERIEKPKFTIKPIDALYFHKKKAYKNPATLPNKMMAIQELFDGLSAVKKSIMKLNPIKKKIAKKYKGFVAKVRHGIMTMSEGKYVNYYPPGVYDKEYEPVEIDSDNRRSDQMSSSEINETIIEPPNNYTYIESIDDNMDQNDSFIENDYDEDGFIKKSFGYKVTIYRSPENGERNFTEDVINEDQNNDNKTNDLVISESSNESPVTTILSTDSDSKPSLDVSQTEKHGELKGRGKIVDYNRNKFSKDRGSHAREEKNANKLKKVDTHDKRASNERALKERTSIEFFEREHILDTAFNKDKLGIDKGKEDANDVHYSSETHNESPITIKHPDGVSIRESYTQPEAHESNYDRNHVTNGQTFDTTFPGHDHKYKHKDNAHKYKGWRERGYKIVTETEFVDRGQKVDTGYKKQEKGNSEHIKEHSAKDKGRGDKRKYYKNIKQLNKNYDSQYGIQDQNSNDKDEVQDDKPNQYPIYDNQPSEKPYDNKQAKEQENDDNEQSDPEQTSVERLPKSDINNINRPYGTRLSSLNSKDLWQPIIKQTSAHSNQNDFYPKTNDDNSDDNSNYDNIDHYSQKFNDEETNTGKFEQNRDQDYVNPDSYDNPYSQLRSKGVTNDNYEHQKDPYYYHIPDQKYYSNLDTNMGQNLNSDHNNYQNNQTEHNQQSFDDNYSNQENNDPINYSTIGTNGYSNEYPSDPPIYSSNYFYDNSTYVRNHDNVITPHYESSYDISPTKYPSDVTNRKPFYDYQMLKLINRTLYNNHNNYDQKENYRPHNFRVETMPAISAKGRSQQNFNSNPNFQNNLIDSPFANEVIHIQEAPNLSTDEYPKETIRHEIPETMSTTMTESPKTSFNKRPKSIKTKLKNITRKPRLRVKLKNKIAEKYHLVPASPLLLPPILPNLFMNSNQFYTPYISPTVQYQFKVPFPVPTQLPTHLPLLMQSSSTPFMAEQSLDLDPSNGQPVAVLHPNKMLSMTTPGVLKRRPHFVSNLWTSLNPLSPFRWVINNNNIVNRFRVQRQSMPNGLKFNLMKPLINQKITFENNDTRSLFKSLFKLRKEYDYKQ